jgi:hypothetical protein
MARGSIAPGKNFEELSNLDGSEGCVKIPAHVAITAQTQYQKIAHPKNRTRPTPGG